MFSRLYLGVHSPADIVAGGIIGCVILAYWIKIDTIVDRSISFGDNGMYCCSTDSLIVHFREWMVPQFHLQFQYSVNQAYRLCEKCFILVPICPLILSFSRFPWLEATRGIASLPFPPLDGMQATLCQASLALIVQIESHTTVRGKFLEQIGTTEALPGSWTWTCQFRVYNNNADIEQFIKVIWYTVYCSLCTQLNEKLTH